MAEGPVKLHYKEVGGGIPLILLHGYPLDHSIWMPVAHLVKHRARVIVPDLRGFGRSPLGGPISGMRLMAEDIAALMDELQIERAILAGHSMGGYVCLSFARAYPRRLMGLAMVASQAVADTPDRQQARLNAARVVRCKGVGVVADEMPARLTGQPQWIDPLKKLILSANSKSIQAALRGMAERPDGSDWLAEISAPALVITGTQDVLIPAQQARLMAQMLQHAWLVEIKDAAHMPMLEAPETVADALLQLVAQSIAGACT